MGCCVNAPRMSPDYTPSAESVLHRKPFGKLLSFYHTTKAHTLVPLEVHHIFKLKNSTLSPESRIFNSPTGLHNNIFHSFTSNLSFLKIFKPTVTKFDLKSIPSGPKTLILIRLSEWVEANVIAKIIQFSFQKLFMGRN